MGSNFYNQIIKGRWYDINNKVEKIITAKYHKIKDWVMDPKGYFLITVDKKKLGNSPSHDMVTEINGQTAIEVLNTLIREKFISTLQHSGDMGIELCKAELALKYNLNYIQDKDLNLK